MPSTNLQTGIFGTAAAIETIALASSSLSLHARAATGALPFAPAIYTTQADQEQQRAAEGKGDLATTYKVAALAQAWAAAKDIDDTFSNSLDQAIECLRSLRNPDWGWSDYSNNSRTSEFHPTVVALYALRAANRLTLEDVSLVAPMLSTMSGATSGISLWAMLSMALDGLHEDTTDLACADLLYDAHKRIREWIKDVPHRASLYAVDGYDYRSAEKEAGGPGKRYSFMFYMPHCLVSLAVIQSATLYASAQNRGYAGRVVRSYARRVGPDMLVRPDGRVRDATVETLWVARLFKAYIERPKPPATLIAVIRRLIEPVISSPLWRHAVRVSIIATGTFIAVFFGIWAGNTITGHAGADGIGVIFSIFSSALSSIVAAIIIDGQERW